jgi:hypothetical protein
VAVQRQVELEQIEAAHYERARNEHAAQVPIADEVHHPLPAAVGPARPVVGQATRQESPREQGRHGQQSEIKIRAHMAEMVDRKSREDRAQQIGDGHDQRVEVEVAGARRTAAERADQRLHRHLHEDESGAGHRGGDEQHRVRGPDPGQQYPERRDHRAGDDRQAHAVAIAELSDRDREQQREHAVDGEQQPGVERPRSELQRVERVRYARALVAGVPQQNDREELVEA